VTVAVLGLIAWLTVAVARGVDWTSVGSALHRLAWWQAPILVALLLARQVLSAAPVARFVAGLGLTRALHNEVAANLVATVAPPPGDMVLRVAMFRSWGVDAVGGMAGVTLATTVFWGARFLAPPLGLAVVAARGIREREWLVASISAAIAVAIIAVLLVLLRSENWADAGGRFAARAVTRVWRPVDAEAWAAAVVGFRAQVSATLRAHLAPALALMLAGILAEGLLLLASLRFVGVGGSLSAIEILGVFLLAYPLTILPFLGLGVLDAALVALWLTDSPAVPEATLVAGMVVWRAVSLGGTLVIGALSLAWWRWTTRGTSVGADVP